MTDEQLIKLLIAIRRLAVLPYPFPFLDDDLQDCLIGLNDDDLAPFSEIADYIERNIDCEGDGAP
ncbi:MAG: hypothetical protein FWD08_00255 [Alphaproteobacteria bacterium]|nr:hypothetical protein [Alphaproteobacteria bacterium]